MSFNVFFAWQMDTSLRLNRWFIETAVKTAIKKLRAEVKQPSDNELKLEPAAAVDRDEPTEINPERDPDDSEIVYQWGAQGHVGASMIAETILERIDACGVFIADLTFTADVNTADNRTKQVPNANVLIELGAAGRTGSGWDRVVLVMNTHFGPVDNLPFDLKHRQCQVKYTLGDWNDPDRPRKAKQLAEDFADILRPMYQKELKRALEARRNAAEAEGTALNARKQWAEAERKAYEDKLLTQTYRKNFKASVGLLVVTVIPADPQPIPHQPDRYYYQHRLAPIWSSKGYLKQEMKSVLCFWPSEEKPLTSITEMSNYTGSIYAVRTPFWDLPNHTPEPRSKLKYRFLDVERPIAEAVQRYVNTLKEQGLKGPLFVGVSLLNVKGFRMDFGEPWGDDDWFIGDNDPESIQTDLLTLKPDEDTSNEDTVFEFLKPAFRQVWKAFHVPGRPSLTSTGMFIGFDG